MIWATVLSLVLGLARALTGNYNYEDCGSAARILSMNVEPCDTQPCVFLRGKDTKIHFSIIADQDSEWLRLEPTMRIFGVTLPVPGMERDMCKEVYHCPMVKGGKYNGTMTVHVPFYAPPFEVKVQLKMIGEKGVSICTSAATMFQ
ncbi:mite group 2 allergen-like Ixo r 2 isoform X3 [Rhipicephalus sanguineus]|uniref:mite group 2 allergen-like Ixo r 2 isoform X3 n=1 Tax=Rhipicephalus sanguineus TaxID=34632 RepID=UPI0018946AAB|nr:mite group 2 allergen-like Ixo r 2 isoform X3 [Rhipicephalus sanguineus]